MWGKKARTWHGPGAAKAPENKQEEVVLDILNKASMDQTDGSFHRFIRIHQTHRTQGEIPGETVLEHMPRNGMWTVEATRLPGYNVKLDNRKVGSRIFHATTTMTITSNNHDHIVIMMLYNMTSLNVSSLQSQNLFFEKIVSCSQDELWGVAQPSVVIFGYSTVSHPTERRFHCWFVSMYGIVVRFIIFPIHEVCRTHLIGLVPFTSGKSFERSKV